MLDRRLHSGRADQGKLMGVRGASVGYRIELIPAGRLAELEAEAEADTHATDLDDRDIVRVELALRICAESVRHPETGEPLAPLATWRRLPGTIVGQCARHYAKLAASERPDLDQLGALLDALDTHVRENRSEPWRVFEDYRFRHATVLSSYYGQPAHTLCLAQVAYHAMYRLALAEES